MSARRFNGLSFDFDLGDFKVYAKKFTLDITDNTTAAKRNGLPDGFLVGDLEASGTITVDRTGFSAFLQAARAAGSFQSLKPFDISGTAQAGDDIFKVKVYGCKVKINKLLDVDTGSTDETEFELPFDVTDPNFVEIDGVPYMDRRKNQ